MDKNPVITIKAANLVKVEEKDFPAPNPLTLDHGFVTEHHQVIEKWKQPEYNSGIEINYNSDNSNCYNANNLSGNNYNESYESLHDITCNMFCEVILGIDESSNDGSIEESSKVLQ